MEAVLTSLTSLILSRVAPRSLDDIRNLDPELRDGGLLFLIEHSKPGGLNEALDWYASRLQEMGGSERFLNDPEVRRLEDAIAKLSDFEPWRP